ncbi:MAG: arylesterase [Gammaproteobacteria bacterium]|jgi:acyl-CoA thioesterase-1|nr:arylesterase [Gammaproteobacteria bacterium]MDP6974526.1 arylesterase [Gammaproteobacteria bacterium]
MIISKNKIIESLFSVLILILFINTSFANNPVRIMLYGDSLMAGYGLAQNENLAEELNRNLQMNENTFSILNASISGNTSKNGLSRIDWSLGDNPDIVILCLGANDVLRGISPELTMANLDSIINKFIKNGSIVILAGMLSPENMGSEYQNKFDSIYPKLAKNYDLIFMPFLLEGVALDKKYLQSDYKHPNKLGIKIIASNLLPYVNEALTKI